MDEKIALSTLNKMAPADVRMLIRQGRIDYATAGMCGGYAQANLVVLPKALAYDFLLFTQRNPKSCPVLEVSDEGSRSLRQIAAGADIATDLPRYRVYKRGELVEERTDISEIWQDDFVSFLIGCSFSFEEELISAGVPVRHIEEERNVPMYNTNIPCEPAGIFHGNMVVSMRPLPQDQIVRAALITGDMPRVHGAPIQIGHPETIGIADINTPDYGDMVTIHPGEIPVFWPCGVTPQAAIMATKPELVITHAPGHMFITDVKNVLLKY